MRHPTSWLLRKSRPLRGFFGPVAAVAGRSIPRAGLTAGFAALVVAVWPDLARAESGAVGHADPAAFVVLALAIVLVAAKLGGEVAIRLGQAAVLGELLAGVVLGNLDLFGVALFERVSTDPGVDLLARIGVLVLLFEVGLESTVKQMLSVGPSALFVAVLGVVAPFGLGWAVAHFLLPEAGFYAHLFIGATLTATSVGITARVLRDIGRSDSPEARIILGAAVIDDILGLVILAVVSAMISGADRGENPSPGAIAWVLGKSLGFLVIALSIGVWASRQVFGGAARLRGKGVLIALCLAFCFFLSWAADAIGLASIVGAFSAGLILEDVHTKAFAARGEPTLEHLLRPISSFLVPVFFVVMGLRTDLRAFADIGVLGLAMALTLAAILGKQACSLGVRGAGVDRISVGLGMIPRGEVGLIFANIGLSLKIDGHSVIPPEIFAAIVGMVIVTTLITPPLLKWRMGAD